MKTTLDYLNEVIQRHAEICNDNQLALFLNITRQAVYQYKRGQNMSVEVALKIADILCIQPLETVAATMYAQARSKEAQQFWETIYEAARCK